jgi:DNA-binding transcriptional ArsR family regulator
VRAAVRAPGDLGGDQPASVCDAVAFPPKRDSDRLCRAYSVRQLFGLKSDPALTLLLSTMEGSILELLEEYGSLGYEQIAALLSEPAAAVRSALTDLRESGLVDAISVGELQAHTAEAASYWRLTDAGRQELARRRSE